MKPRGGLNLWRRLQVDRDSAHARIKSARCGFSNLLAERLNEIDAARQLILMMASERRFAMQAL